MHLEAGGNAGQRRADALERFAADGGSVLDAFGFRVGLRHAGPVPFQPVGLVGLVGFAGGIRVFQSLRELVPHCLPFGRADHAFRDKPLGVQRARSLGLVDGAIHQRLGECRFVGLVVPVAAIADDVQHDVGGEAHAELCGHARAEDHCLRVVAVDVQDRCLDRLRHIGAIEAGIGMRRHRGEADLVVHHQMHSATGAVADELAHRQCLVHQALAGECRVAVHEDRHHRAAPLRISRLVLPRAHLADHHRIDGFQVRRVGLQRQMDAMAGHVDVGGGAQMVFYVAGALHVVGLEAFAAELREHRGQRLPHDVDQRVQPAAMRHPDSDFLHPGGRHGLDDGVQRRDAGLAALQAKALGGDVPFLAERLEALRFSELRQDRALGLGIECGAPGGAFHLALDP